MLPVQGDTGIMLLSKAVAYIHGVPHMLPVNLVSQLSADGFWSSVLQQCKSRRVNMPIPPSFAGSKSNSCHQSIHDQEWLEPGHWISGCLTLLDVGGVGLFSSDMSVGDAVHELVLPLHAGDSWLQSLPVIGAPETILSLYHPRTCSQSSLDLWGRQAMADPPP